MKKLRFKSLRQKTMEPNTAELNAALVEHGTLILIITIILWLMTAAIL